MDAIQIAPVEDWHVASLLISLLNTNDLRSLLSVNNRNTNTWQNLLGGLTALTNVTSDAFVEYANTPQFDTLAISSDSPQASVIAEAVQSARAAQPGGYFHDVGDVLAAAQLADESPFLNWNDPVQQQHGLTDEAYEKIPSQLLTLLRADSVGSISSTNGQSLMQFTGYDGHAYGVEASSNLADWSLVSTNYPADGTFDFTNTATPIEHSQFYRSVLLQ